MQNTMKKKEGFMDVTKVCEIIIVILYLVKMIFG